MRGMRDKIAIFDDGRQGWNPFAINNYQTIDDGISLTPTWLEMLNRKQLECSHSTPVVYP